MKIKLKKISLGIAIALYQILATLALHFPCKRNTAILADAIFDRKMELIDALPLFKKMVSDERFDAYYIINKQQQNADYLKSIYGKRIITHNGSYFILLCKIFPLFFRLKFWLDGYFLLIGPLKILAKIFKKSQNIISINLQHGVTYFKIDTWEKSQGTLGPDVYSSVVVSTKEEKDFFKGLGYSENNLIPFGLTRWSAPWEEKENKILIFFTWREEFRGKDKQYLRNSTYWGAINSLISSKKFISICKNNCYTIEIAAHHVLYEYGLLDGLELNNQVKLISFDELDNAKKTANILITDYSSLCFDFMFKKRKCIFIKIDNDSKNKRDNAAKMNASRALTGKSNYFQSIEDFIDELEYNFNSVIKTTSDDFATEFLLEQDQIIDNYIKWTSSKIE